MLLVTVCQHAGSIESPPSFGQDVHRFPLPRLGFSEIPLSRHLVSTCFDPLGIERTETIFSSLDCPFGVRKLELGLPVHGFGGGKFLLGPTQLTSAPNSLFDAEVESSYTSERGLVTSTSSTTLLRSGGVRPRRAASSSSIAGPSISTRASVGISTRRKSAVDRICGAVLRGRGPKPLCESGRTRRPLRMVSAPARSTSAACSVASTSDKTVAVNRKPASVACAWACSASR